MNREMFLRVADVIELEDRFNLNHWILGAEHTGELVNNCSTTGCIAGWACALAGHRLRDEEEIESAGRDVLGLDALTADRLFGAGQDSVWCRHADAFGWEVAPEMDGWSPGLRGWEQIQSHQAAKVLRQIAYGEIEL